MLQERSPRDDVWGSVCRFVLGALLFYIVWAYRAHGAHKVIQVGEPNLVEAPGVEEISQNTPAQRMHDRDITGLVSCYSHDAACLMMLRAPALQSLHRDSRAYLSAAVGRR